MAAATCQQKGAFQKPYIIHKGGLGGCWGLTCRQRQHSSSNELQNIRLAKELRVCKGEKEVLIGVCNAIVVKRGSWNNTPGATPLTK